MEWIKQNKGFLALIIFSVIWVISAIWLLYSELSKESFYPVNISLNELGDYLAGAFSPLAFIWLVYGYFMQNHELAMNRKELLFNREAIKEQAVELRKSAEEQKELVRIQKLELEVILNKELPTFNISSSYYYPKGSVVPMPFNSRKAKSDEIYLYIKNWGSNVKNIFATTMAGERKLKSNIANPGESNFSLNIELPNKIDKPILVQIHFTTESQKRYIQTYVFKELNADEHSLSPELMGTREDIDVD